MDRKKALEILGLKETASTDDIIRRMDVLFRKFRSIERDERGYTLADIEEAYRILRGISFTDERAEAEKRRRAQRPNPILKLLKIDEEKARNFIYYYKWHVIIGAVVLALIISFIMSIVNRVDPNLKIIIGKEIYMQDTVKLEEMIEKEVAGATEVQIQNIFLTENMDPQAHMALTTKLVVEVSQGQNDIFIMDENTYREYASKGLFKPLDDILQKLGTDPAIHEDLKTALELDDGNTYEPKLYGLDVTDSVFLKNAGVIGNRLIVAQFEKGLYSDNARAFIEKLFLFK